MLNIFLKNIKNKFFSKIKNKNILFNVYNKSYTNNVLVSYIVEPFINGVNYTHTNYQECMLICKVFDELNYNVDLIDYNNETTKVNYQKYEIIFGFGHSLEESFKFNELFKSIKIYYGTGNHLYYINTRSIQRIDEKYKETGKILLTSARYFEKAYSLQNILSDAMILLGNNLTKETFELTFKKNIYTLDATFYKTIFSLNDKNITTVKKTFVWFGSSGLVHKGLDITLEIFKKRTELKLHVCGANPYESSFFDLYNDHLNNSDNIINHGFVDINSKLFKSIIEDSLFVIFPSLSEGGCPSVITLMGNGGLIPIVSRSSCIDVDDYGFVFDECTIDNVEATINKAIAYDDIKLKTMSNNSYSNTNIKHSQSNYVNNLKSFLIKIIDDYKNESRY